MRQLLVHKKESREISNKLATAGLTIVPLSVYLQRNRIVVECAIVRGKKKHDKRQTLRKREDERKIRRELKVR